MLLRLATLGAVGYAAYKYYENNRRTLAGASEPNGEDASIRPAGGPISAKASLVHPGESPVD